MQIFLMKALTGYLLAIVVHYVIQLIYPTRVRKKMNKKELINYEKGVFYYTLACMISPWVFGFSL